MLDKDLLNKCIKSQEYARQAFNYDELTKKLASMLNLVGIGKDTKYTL